MKEIDDIKKKIGEKKKEKDMNFDMTPVADKVVEKVKKEMKNKDGEKEIKEGFKSLGEDNKDIKEKLDEIKVKEYPTKIEVKNFPELPKSIEVSNFPKQKNEIKVKNPYDDRGLIGVVKALGIGFAGALKQLSHKVFRVEIKSQNAPDYIPVKLVNLDDKFYNIPFPAGVFSGGGVSFKKANGKVEEALIDGSRRVVVVIQGTLPNAAEYTMAIENNANGDPKYIGEAVPGSLKTAAAWRIKLITYDGSNDPIDIQWADGDANFDKIWNSRPTYSYS